MSTMNSNTTLLQAKDQFPSDKTPAPLTGPAQSVQFATKQAAPPSILYIQRDDRLLVLASSPLAGAIVTVTVRLLLADTATIQTIQQALPPTVAAGAVFTQIDLAEGYLLSVVATTSIGGPGQPVFCECLINRGNVGNPPSVPGQVLFTDYVTTLGFVGWPFGRMVKSNEGPGWARTFVVGNPAPGVDWTTTVPTNSIWELVAFGATFTASAAVANRQIQLQILGAGGFTVFQDGANSNLVATNVAVISGAQVTPNTPIIATDIELAIQPDNRLPGGYVIRMSTVGIQAADAWTNIALLVNEWVLF